MQHTQTPLPLWNGLSLAARVCGHVSCNQVCTPLKVQGCAHQTGKRKCQHCPNQLPPPQCTQLVTSWSTPPQTQTLPARTTNPPTPNCYATAMLLVDSDDAVLCCQGVLWLYNNCCRPHNEQRAAEQLTNTSSTTRCCGCTAYACFCSSASSF